MHVHVSILPQTPLLSRLPLDIEQSSLCFRVGPCLFTPSSWRYSSTISLHPRLSSKNIFLFSFFLHSELQSTWTWFLWNVMRVGIGFHIFHYKYQYVPLTQHHLLKTIFFPHFCVELPLSEIKCSGMWGSPSGLSLLFLCSFGLSLYQYQYFNVL